MSTPNTTIRWTVTSSDGADDCEVELSCHYIPPIPASRQGHPDNWTEGDPGDCEIVRWSLADHEPINDWIAERMADDDFRNALTCDIWRALNKRTNE